MNSFLRNLEAQRLAERESLMSQTRGRDLPTDPQKRGECNYDSRSLRKLEAEQRRAARESKLKAVSLVMDSGRPVAELCAELQLTERQYFQAKAVLKRRQS